VKGPLGDKRLGGNSTNSPTTAGTVLLLLVTEGAQSAAQLGEASGLDHAEVVRQLRRLMVNGFLIVGHPDSEGVRLFKLQPRGVRLELDPHQRILTVNDKTLLRDFVALRLEDMGYVVIATALPADVATLLDEVSFDLVITDSFSPRSSGVLAGPAGVLAAAGSTPVALFTSHPVELKEAQAKGFRDVIRKPFDIGVMERQVRTLLSS